MVSSSVQVFDCLLLLATPNGPKAIRERLNAYPGFEARYEVIESLWKSRILQSYESDMHQSLGASNAASKLDPIIESIVREGGLQAKNSAASSSVPSVPVVSKPPVLDQRRGNEGGVLKPLFRLLQVLLDDYFSIDDDANTNLSVSQQELSTQQERVLALLLEDSNCLAPLVTFLMWSQKRSDYNSSWNIYIMHRVLWKHYELSFNSQWNRKDGALKTETFASIYSASFNFLNQIASSLLSRKGPSTLSLSTSINNDYYLSASNNNGLFIDKYPCQYFIKTWLSLGYREAHASILNPNINGNGWFAWVQREDPIFCNCLITIARSMEDREGMEFELLTGGSNSSNYSEIFEPISLSPSTPTRGMEPVSSAHHNDDISMDERNKFLAAMLKHQEEESEQFANLESSSLIVQISQSFKNTLNYPASAGSSSAQTAARDESILSLYREKSLFPLILEILLLTCSSSSSCYAIWSILDLIDRRSRDVSEKIDPLMIDFVRLLVSPRYLSLVPPTLAPSPDTDLQSSYRVLQLALEILMRSNKGNSDDPTHDDYETFWQCHYTSLRHFIILFPELQTSSSNNNNNFEEQFIVCWLRKSLILPTSQSINANTVVSMSKMMEKFVYASMLPESDADRRSFVQSVMLDQTSNYSWPTWNSGHLVDWIQDPVILSLFAQICSSGGSLGDSLVERHWKHVLRTRYQHLSSSRIQVFPKSSSPIVYYYHLLKDFIKLVVVL